MGVSLYKCLHETGILIYPGYREDTLLKETRSITLKKYYPVFRVSSLIFVLYVPVHRVIIFNIHIGL
jgi:hypothetical protein